MIELEWITKAGLSALALIVCRENGRKSHRCGYVGLPRPGFAIDPQWNTIQDLQNFSVHGGITYAKYQHPNSGTATPHMAWVGFDCHHLNDAEIEPDPAYRGFAYMDGDRIVRSLEFVVNECEQLAPQVVPWILPMG